MKTILRTKVFIHVNHDKSCRMSLFNIVDIDIVTHHWFKQRLTYPFVVHVWHEYFCHDQLYVVWALWLIYEGRMTSVRTFNPLQKAVEIVNYNFFHLWEEQSGLSLIWPQSLEDRFLIRWLIFIGCHGNQIAKKWKKMKLEMCSYKTDAPPIALGKMVPWSSYKTLSCYNNENLTSTYYKNLNLAKLAQVQSLWTVTCGSSCSESRIFLLYLSPYKIYSCYNNRNLEIFLLQKL